MRLRQKIPAREVLVLTLCLSIAMVVAVTTAVGGQQSATPTPYRFAGAVENNRGAPAHRIMAGDGFWFLFFDALSQGRASERYKLCLAPPGRSPVRCWQRNARFGFGRVAYAGTLPSNVPFGVLDARWFVNGRVVATWRFRYLRGSG
jgi:hypothetical protein